MWDPDHLVVVAFVSVACPYPTFLSSSRLRAVDEWAANLAVGNIDGNDHGAANGVSQGERLAGDVRAFVVPGKR